MASTRRITPYGVSFVRIHVYFSQNSCLFQLHQFSSSQHKSLYFPARLFLSSIIYNNTVAGWFRNAQISTLHGKLPLFFPTLTKTKMAHSYVVEFFNIIFHEKSFIHSLLVTEGGQAEKVFVKRGFSPLTLFVFLCPT